MEHGRNGNFYHRGTQRDTEDYGSCVFESNDQFVGASHIF
jgi:hypothetical protein